MTQTPPSTAGGDRRIGFVVTLGALAAVSATAIDVMIPAQPTIARDFGVEASAGAALVSAYFLGYGPGQLFWGPVSDRFGRLGPLSIALAGFVIASLGCALTDSFDLLLILRGIQGLLGGAAPVIARAIARDQGREQSATLLTTMTVILGVAPLLAPSVGSGLLALFDWRSIFYFLVLFGILTALGSFFFLGETGFQKNLGALAPRIFALSARTLFRAPDFLFGIAISATVFCGYSAFLAMGAAVMNAAFGISPEAFGPVFGLTAIAFLVGSSLARFLVRRWGPERLLTIGAGIVGLVGGLQLLALGAKPDLTIYWVLLCGYFLAMGMILPCATAKALGPAGGMAGVASSFIGVIQTIAGALGSTLAATAFLGDSYMMLSLVMALSGLLCLVARLTALAFQGRVKGLEEAE